MRVNGFDRDITSNRHRGNANSAAAWDRIKSASSEECLTILRALQGCDGMTVKAVARMRGKFPNEVSGRLSQLKEAKYAEDSGRREEGCAVVRITQAGRKALEEMSQRRLF